METSFLLTNVVVFVASLLGTWGVRLYAMREGVLDIPNHRSSHSVPTPRGGGAAIVIAFLMGLLIQQLIMGWNHFIAVLMLASTLIALVGFIDDHRGVSARARIVVHAIAATVLVSAAGIPAQFSIFYVSVELGVWVTPFVVLGIVWLLNLTNFMDGIDGIAGVQAVLASAVVGLLMVLSGSPAVVIWPVCILSAASLGFLWWNFPPAKIFMGDVGSATIGLVFGGLAWWHASFDSKWFYVWLILLGVFIVDATLTLVSRALRKQRLSEAHRTHAYQRAAKLTGSHRMVTLSVGAIIFLWLSPLAALVAFSWLDGALSILIAYIPLCLLALYLRAGQAEIVSLRPNE